VTGNDLELPLVCGRSYRCLPFRSTWFYLWFS